MSVVINFLCGDYYLYVSEYDSENDNDRKTARKK